MRNEDFYSLLKPHYNDVVNYCRALCSGSTQTEAEDVMQQSLMRAYEKFDSIDDKKAFRSWLFQIITRCFYNSIRNPFWKRFASLNSDEAKQGFAIYEEPYFEKHQLLIQALSTLSKKERVALLLFEIGGFSIKEIKDIQNEKSDSAVASRLSRTRKKLKDFMEKAMQEGTGAPITYLNAQSKSIKDLSYETNEIITNIKSIG